MNFDLSEADDPRFIEKIDSMVLEAKDDKEMSEGIAYTDKLAKERGLNFYQMALIITRKHLTKAKAEAWLESKTKQ